MAQTPLVVAPALESPRSVRADSRRRARCSPLLRARETRDETIGGARHGVVRVAVGHPSRMASREKPRTQRGNPRRRRRQTRTTRRDARDGAGRDDEAANAAVWIDLRASVGGRGDGVRADGVARRRNAPCDRGCSRCWTRAAIASCSSCTPRSEARASARRVTSPRSRRNTEDRTSTTERCDALRRKGRVPARYLSPEPELACSPLENSAKVVVGRAATSPMGRYENSHRSAVVVVPAATRRPRSAARGGARRHRPSRLRSPPTPNAGHRRSRAVLARGWRPTDRARRRVRPRIGWRSATASPPEPTEPRGRTRRRDRSEEEAARKTPPPGGIERNANGLSVRIDRRVRRDRRDRRGARPSTAPRLRRGRVGSPEIVAEGDPFSRRRRGRRHRRGRRERRRREEFDWTFLAARRAPPPPPPRADRRSTPATTSSLGNLQPQRRRRRSRAALRGYSSRPRGGDSFREGLTRARRRGRRRVRRRFRLRRGVRVGAAFVAGETTTTPRSRPRGNFHAQSAASSRSSEPLHADERSRVPRSSRWLRGRRFRSNSLGAISPSARSPPAAFPLAESFPARYSRNVPRSPDDVTNAA